MGRGSGEIDEKVMEINLDRTVKWYGFKTLFYLCSDIFVAEDVSSEILKDCYRIILITGYNAFDHQCKSRDR